jgi:hypothetical protein
MATLEKLDKKKIQIAAANLERVIR